MFCDASPSRMALSAILMQTDDDGNNYVIHGNCLWFTQITASRDQISNRGARIDGSDLWINEV